jgi:hypothetical protein
MLRRDFFKAVAAFTAAAASAKAAVAAASPQENAGDRFLCARCDHNATVPHEFAESIKAELDRVSQFEQTLVECLQDGSMVLIGVTGSSVGYEAFYRPAKAPGEPSPEQGRHDSLMAMHRRGMIAVEDVTVWNNYSAVSVRFAICPGA